MTVPLDTVNDIRSMDAARRSRSEIARVLHVSRNTVAWRQRPLEGGYPYVFVDGIYLKRSWGVSHENVAVLFVIGVNSAGDQEIIGCSEGYTESAESWREFFSWLKGRGLSGVRLVTGD